MKTDFIVSPTCFRHRQPSSGRSCKVNGQCPVNCICHSPWNLKPWRKRQRIPPKRRETPGDEATHPRRRKSSITPLKKPHNSYRPNYFKKYPTLHESPAQNYNKCEVNWIWNYTALLYRRVYENKSVVCI